MCLHCREPVLIRYHINTLIREGQALAPARARRRLTLVNAPSRLPRTHRDRLRERPFDAGATIGLTEMVPTPAANLPVDERAHPPVRRCLPQECRLGFLTGTAEHSLEFAQRQS